MPMEYTYEEDQGKEVLDKITVQQLLTNLSPKERETILLWSREKTLKQIAEHISLKYEGRNPGNMLSARAMGVRIRKILQKLKKNAEE